MVGMPRVASRISSRDLLIACDGFYECPRDAHGRRTGPMVGYAGKDAKGRAYIGDVYANFAMVEQWTKLLYDHVAWPLSLALGDHIRRIPVSFCGAPEGGKSLAQSLAFITSSRFFYPEKVVTVAKSTDAREESELVFARHEVMPGERMILVEDVCNNFSTTASLIRTICAAGGEVLAIACFLNRSLAVDEVFTVDGTAYPVIALWRQPIAQYEQDDASVVDDIKRGGLLLKPKHDWDALMHHMKK